MSSLSPSDFTPPVPETEATQSSWSELLQFVAMVLIIVIPIRLFIAQPFVVSGASMEHTFHTNEYLIVDQLSYHFENPQRGEVVVFRYPRDPSKYFIKRIIALPGEQITIEGSTVEITTTAGTTFVLDEPYIKSMHNGTYLETTLGAHEYFVMGDNRDESSDSRVWGALPEENIVGRALVRLFPLTELGLWPGTATDTTQAANELLAP